MQELFHESIRLINLPFTILTLVLACYWIGVIVGVLDVDLLNFDLDLDADIGLDPGDAPGPFARLLQFCHFGEAPFFIILSLLTIFMWTLSVLANYHFNPRDSVLLGLAFLVPNLVVSLIATRFVALPIHNLFRRLGTREEDHLKVVGQLCTVVSSRVNPRSGQAEIATGASPILINARTGGETAPIQKGDECVVVGMNSDGTYTIKKLEIES